MRWKSDPDFEALLDEVAEEETTEQSLASLVPKAYLLLERALAHGDVAAAKARVALDVLKAAASLQGQEEEGESTLAKKLAEIDSSGVQYVPD